MHLQNEEEKSSKRRLEKKKNGVQITSSATGDVSHSSFSILEVGLVGRISSRILHRSDGDEEFVEFDSFLFDCFVGHHHNHSKLSVQF